MKKISFLALVLLIVSIFSVFVLAETQQTPIGPDTLTELNSSRKVLSAIPTKNAYAGNVSALEISTAVITNGWQGYFGNITGTITLDDSSNNTMYDWYLANPEGEIYSTTAAVTSWDNVLCADAENISYHENETYNFNRHANGSIKPVQDVDGIDETFNKAFAGDFYVGSTKISVASGCSAAYLYVNSAADAAGTFSEVLLLDNSTENGNLVFASILFPGGSAGFDGAPHDFQMLVAEDGHNGNEATTLYYFYVEIQ